MKVLVTGCAGFIGSHIVDALLERGHSVVGIDDLSSGNENNIKNKIVWWRGSILSQETWKEIDGMEFDAICHQAAQPSLLTSVKDPRLDADINILGTINVIEAANRCGAHLVMASTSAVYDEHAPLPYSEDARKNPTCPYGISKFAAEMYVRQLSKSYTILRYGNVYGSCRQVPLGENQLWARAIRCMLFGEDFSVNYDGEQTRDFIHVSDVAEANLVAMMGRVSGVFNISTGVETSVNRVVELIGKETGYTKNIPRGNETDARYRVFQSNDKAREILGWTPRIDVETGTKILVKSWRESPEYQSRIN